MKNLEAILAAAGSSFDKVVKTTILLTDMNDFAKVNAVYGEGAVLLCCGAGRGSRTGRKGLP